MSEPAVTRMELDARLRPVDRELEACRERDRQASINHLNTSNSLTKVAEQQNRAAEIIENLAVSLAKEEEARKADIETVHTKIDVIESDQRKVFTRLYVASGIVVGLGAVLAWFSDIFEKLSGGV